MFRPLAALMAGALVVAATASTPTGAADRQQAASSSNDPSLAHRAVLDKYCVTCHNERARTGGLALDQLNLSAVGSNPDVWEKVRRKLRSGAMPPAGRPRPDASTLTALASWITTELDQFAAAHPNPGRTDSLHRLNRAEYQNAIRDLLALDVDAASLLPADQSTQGFDNLAEGLSISSALLDRYLSAARQLSSLALGMPPVSAVVETRRVPAWLDQDAQLNEDMPIGSRGGFSFQYFFPVDGEYELRMALRRMDYDYIIGLEEPHQIEARIDGARVWQTTIGGRHGTPPPLSYVGSLVGDTEWETYNLRMDDNLRFRFKTTAGSHRIGVAFAARLAVPEGIGIAQPFRHDFRNPGHGDESDLMNPAINTVSIGGPYKMEGPGDTPSRRRVLICKPAREADESACAKKIIAMLARRAYRGQVGDRDLDTLFSFYEQGRRGADFDAGIQFALERILADARFLFRIERDPAALKAGSSYRVSDLELASRLSFFLWSSIPDDELLDAAARGKLKDPVVSVQARRLLTDSRSNALLDNFIGQWLEIRNLQTASPNERQFPEFTDNLREAFQRETELFVEDQVREDHSVLDLLTANYTFLNERLARFYGIRNVRGEYFRKVSFDANVPRAGLLTQASVLTVTSYPDRTSPVLRGKWLLQNVLGTPPPPPPPDVPALKDRGENGAPASVRARLERHRANAVCATCHAQMDPLGFALENFNPIGGFRTNDQGSPVDSSAVAIDGTKIQGAAGLRQFLMGRSEQFVETFTEKLLAYALGRSLQYYDMPAVRTIVRDARATNYRWSSLVTGIVNSAPFQMRQARAAETAARADAPAGRP